MKSKTYIQQYDYYIFVIFVILMIIGLFMQLNISSIRSKMDFFNRQTIWVGLSIFSLLFAFKVVNLEKIRKYSLLFILVTILFLIAVLIFGTAIKGAVRSIKIAGINIQPSLFARIVLIFYFAHILDKKQKIIKKTTPIFFLQNFSALIIIPTIIFILILCERHFSTLIISGFTLISMLYLAKIKYSTILVFSGIVLIIGILIVSYGAEYRSNRMDIFYKYSLFHPNSENKNKDFKNEQQIKESLIAFSSGKIFGTTPQKGTGKHYFLPEAKTDYIFAIIGEEFGFLGAFFILILYIFLFSRSFINSKKQDSFFLQLLGLGLGMNIFYNAIVNIGVAMSSIPSTGVTLPFISYGGTSLIVNSFTIGLLMNISAKRRIL